MKKTFVALFIAILFIFPNLVFGRDIKTEPKIKNTGVVKKPGVKRNTVKKPANGKNSNKKRFPAKPAKRDAQSAVKKVEKNESHAHPAAKGHAHKSDRVERTFLNTDCKKNDSCDLKSFTVITEEYEVWFSDYDPEPTVGSGMIAEYTTSSVGTLEDFAIVNFIRGCPFNAFRTESGEIKKLLGYTISEYFGVKYLTYCFPNWVIDSIDRDPVYNSDPELGRHYLYQWNTVPKSYDKRTQKFFGIEKPPYPKLYVTDLKLPGAFLSSGWANNVSLQFRTCIYKTKDVPRETTPDNINFATPIQCFEWQNIYVYNFDSGIFERKNEIDPFCLEDRKNKAAP